MWMCINSSHSQKKQIQFSSKLIKIVKLLIINIIIKIKKIQPDFLTLTFFSDSFDFFTILIWKEKH